MKVYLGADHRGFELKEKIKSWLESEGYTTKDLGAHEYVADDDYPVFAERIGRAVMAAAPKGGEPRPEAGRDEEGRGIVLCGSGAGAVAAVNKIKGIRGTIGFDPEQVKAGRNDDDMNVLVIAADFIGLERAEKIVKAFLETPFDKRTARYQHRLNQIAEIEKQG